MFLAETPRARDYGEKRDGNKREPKTIIIIKFLIPGRLKTKARVFIRRTAGPFVWCKFIRGPGSCSTAVARRLARGTFVSPSLKRKMPFFSTRKQCENSGHRCFHRRSPPGNGARCYKSVRARTKKVYAVCLHLNIGPKSLFERGY